MPIYTIKAKNAHPITSKIPMLLWIEGLDREFHDEALRVEGKSFKELTIKY